MRTMKPIFTPLLANDLVPRCTKTVLRGLAAALLAGAFGLFFVSGSTGQTPSANIQNSLAATTISVSDGDVAGLIAAIQTLNSSGGGTIQLAPNGNYSVTQPSDWWYGPNAFPAISSAVVIQGNGATISRVAGSPKFRFFYVSGGFSTLPAGTLTLQGLTLSGGLAQGGRGGDGGAPGGGGAGMGGAIFNQGNTSLIDVQLIQNMAQGGNGGSPEISGINNALCSGQGGGGGLGGDGGAGCGPIVGNLAAGGGGGFRFNGIAETGGGGSFTGTGASGLNGGVSPFGGNGGNGNTQATSGGGGGFTPGDNGGTPNGGTGGGQGGFNFVVATSGGGGELGGGGAGNASAYATGGGGGVGGGGGGGHWGGGNGGFGGGGGGSDCFDSNCHGSAGGFGGGSGSRLNSGSSGGAGLGGAIFNHMGTLTLLRTSASNNVARGGAGDFSATGPSRGATGVSNGGVLFNVNGTVTIQDSSIGGSNGNTADSGYSVFELSSNGANTTSGQTPVTLLHLLSTPLSTASGDLVNLQLDGTALVVALDNLKQAYTGSPLSPTVTTVPAGLSVTLTGAPQIAPGTYPVTATVIAPNYTDVVSGNFVIKATATIIFSHLSQTYTGRPLMPTATTVPAGLQVVFSGAPQTNAGSYQVTATVVDPNYEGSQTQTFVINPAAAVINFSNLTTTYNGRAQSPTVTTTPAGLSNSLTTSSGSAINVGGYFFTATITDPNYVGSAISTFAINRAAATASVVVKPLYYSKSAGTTTATNPAPAACSGVAPPCQQWSDTADVSVTISPTIPGAALPLDAANCSTAGGTVVAPCVTVNGGGLSLPMALSLDPATNSLTGIVPGVPVASLGVSPGVFAYKVFPVSVNRNYTLSTPSVNVTVKQEAATLIYSGLTDFTTKPGATTQNLFLSYSVQDPTAAGPTNANYDPFAGDVRFHALAKLKLTGTSPAGAFTSTSTIQETVGSGPGQGSFVYVFNNVPVNGTYTLTASPATGSAYTWDPNATKVTITNGNDGGGSLHGQGWQTAEYLAAADPENAKYSSAGLITPAPGTKVNFKFDGKYKVKGMDTSATIEIEAPPLNGIAGYTAHPNRNGLCEYQIRADEIESLTIEEPFEKWLSTATILDVTNNTPVVVASNVHLQMEVDANSDSRGGAAKLSTPTLTIQVMDDINGLWFSNNWSGVDTPVSLNAPVIQNGIIAFR